MIKLINVTETGLLAGPQIRIINITPVLEKYDVDTLVICPKRPSLLKNRLRKEGIKFQAIDLHHLSKYPPYFLKYMLTFIWEILSLRKVIQQHKGDLVHCNGSWQIKGVIAAKLAGVKTVWMMNDSRNSKIIVSLFPFFANSFVDAFILNSERTKQYYLNGNKLLADKPNSIIQSPVDTNKFDPDFVQPDTNISKLPGIKIGVVANIQPAKGISEVLQMANLLQKGGYEFSVVFVGEVYKSQEKYYRQVKRFIDNHQLKNIHFVGWKDQVSEVLNAIDIFVSASWAEGSPISVWEAMSMAKPIVSTDVGDVAKFIIDGENGFVIPVRSVPDLTERVAELLSDEPLRDKFGKKARKVAVEKLDVEVCARKHSDFYKSVLS